MNHGPDRKQPAQVSALRDRIMSAAFAVFSERGLAAASTLEIASRAQVSKREIYRSFGSKQALFAECLGAVAARAQRINHLLDLPPPVDAAALSATLEAFGTALLREISHPLVLAMHRLAAAGARRTPELALVLHTGWDGGRRTLARLLAGAQLRSLLGPGEPLLQAEQFGGLLWGNLLVDLILGIVDPPGEAEVQARARNAAAALLKLHPAARKTRRR